MISVRIVTNRRIELIVGELIQGGGGLDSDAVIMIFRVAASAESSRAQTEEHGSYEFTE